MKKITIYIVLALLCLNFKAQAQDNKAVDVTLKGIQIGQKVPDFIITNLHNYKNSSGKPATTAKFSDFKGKLLILDFWATWCSPCVAMIPKMDSLQKSFGDKIQFLSVTYQTEKEVMPFMAKLEKRMGRSFGLPMLNGDEKLHGLFPHKYLPHYVWIDVDGKVMAITGFQEVDEKRIRAVLDGTAQLMAKADVVAAYDLERPLLIGGNGGDGDNLRYHSLLTGYTEGLVPSGSTRTDSVKGRKISLLNTSILRLAQTAYSDSGRLFNQYNTLMEVVDANKLRSGKKSREHLQWLMDGNGFCYELIVPLNIAQHYLAYMREDLRRNFSQYQFNVEIRELPYYVLVRKGSGRELTTDGGKPTVKLDGMGIKMQNVTFGNMLYRLNFLKRMKRYVLDETGFKGKLDLEVDANLSDLKAINVALDRYGLEMVEAVRKKEALVISDYSK